MDHIRLKLVYYGTFAVGFIFMQLWSFSHEKTSKITHDCCHTGMKIANLDSIVEENTMASVIRSQSSVHVECTVSYSHLIASFRTSHMGRKAVDM